jgi:hypothetical protein
MKKDLLLLARIICCIACTIIFNHPALLAQSGIYGGGPIYKNRSYSISELKNSGYTYVVVWTIHIDASGHLNFNAEFPLVQNGAYIGASLYPNFASDIASLKTAPTSINRVEFCLSAWGSSTFAHIKNLIASQGTGSSSILYRNFQALKNAFPTVDAIGFDDESTYDAPSATAFAVMLADLGFKISLCPYTASSFWTSVATNTNNQRPGTVDRIDLQCYAGGAGNNPCNWNFGSVPLSCGLWDQEKTTSQVQTQLSSWKNQCGIDGGFIWLYDDIDNSSLTAQYASAVNNAFGGTPATVATFYKDCNYGGYAVGLAPGSYTLAQLNARGILNDDISSLRVTSGYRVTLYWDNNFLGSTLVKTADDACLVDDGWNDKVSSLVIASTAGVRTVTENNIYTLPGRNEIQVQHLSGVPVQIFDITGRLVLKTIPLSNRVNISGLMPGVYLLSYTKDGVQVTRRFVK